MANRDDAVTRAARTLCDHRIARRRFQHLPDDCRPRDEPEAYRVQAELHGLLAQAGMGLIAGHKIGCTTQVMQKFLSIDNPCAGGVFERAVHRDFARVRHADYLHVGIECEIVVWLDADLPANAAPFTAASVAPVVGAISPGIEIVDDRYDDYKTMDTSTLIADDFFNAGCVIGEAHRDWRSLDIAALTGRTLINGAEAGRGLGGDVMGHPLEALAWLANSLASRDDYLRRGQFVFTGSVVETRWVQAGDSVSVEIDRLGKVRADFLA
jgi:2-keto-4-pentenoate hydratase